MLLFKDANFIFLVYLIFNIEKCVLRNTVFYYCRLNVILVVGMKSQLKYDLYKFLQDKKYSSCRRVAFSVKCVRIEVCMVILTLMSTS